MIETITDMRIIIAQLLIFIFLVAIHQFTVFGEERRALGDFSPSISVGVETPTSWERAKPPQSTINANHLVSIVKKGMENIPTKREILYSPLIEQNYSMLADLVPV